MYMYMYMHLYLCMFHIYICIYKYIFIWRRKAPGHMQSPIIYGPVHVCTYLYICIYIPIISSIHLYICIFPSFTHTVSWLEEWSGLFFFFAVYIYICAVCIYICIYIYIFGAKVYVHTLHTNVSWLEKCSGLFFFLEKSPAHRMHLLLQCVFWRWFRRRMDFVATFADAV